MACYGRMDDKAHVIEIYNAHNERVQKNTTAQFRSMLADRMDRS